MTTSTSTQLERPATEKEKGDMRMMVVMSKYGSGKREEKTIMRSFEEREREENREMVGSEMRRENMRSDMVIEDGICRPELRIEDRRRKSEVKHSDWIHRFEMMTKATSLSFQWQLAVVAGLLGLAHAVGYQAPYDVTFTTNFYTVRIVATGWCCFNKRHPVRMRTLAPARITRRDTHPFRALRLPRAITISVTDTLDSTRRYWVKKYLQLEQSTSFLRSHRHKYTILEGGKAKKHGLEHNL